MNILSLFDGISCGRIALERAGIKIDTYFASEIKKDSIKVSKDNYPDIVQLGDITKIDFSKLPQIDLLIGGSPCQDLSQANSERLGLKGNKSSLFWYYIKALKELKPKHFLLENVYMPKTDYEIISKEVGTYPVRINSSLVSAQLRDRFYWTNIGQEDYDLLGNRYCGIPQPLDKNIKLQDILENGITDRNKSRTLLESDSRPLKNKKNILHRYFNTGFTTVVFEKELSEYAQKKIKERLKGKCPVAYNWFNDRELNEKSGTIISNDGWSGKGTTLIVEENNVRYLTQLELERLQTLPEGYTKVLNRNKAASCIGDGWTVDVIAHIFSFMEKK